MRRIKCSQAEFQIARCTSEPVEQARKWSRIVRRYYSTYLIMCLVFM